MKRKKKIATRITTFKNVNETIKSELEKYNEGCKRKCCFEIVCNVPLVEQVIFFILFLVVCHSWNKKKDIEKN